MNDLWDEDDRDQEASEQDDLWTFHDWAHHGPCYGCDLYAELDDLG